MIKSNSSGLILSIHDDFPVRDFPHWFETFFNQQLNELLEGKEIEIPGFDFQTGKRKKSGN